MAAVNGNEDKPAPEPVKGSSQYKYSPKIFVMDGGVGAQTSQDIKFFGYCTGEMT